MQKAIFIRNNGRYTRINLNDIVYVEGLRNYIKINCKGKSFLVLMSLKKMYGLLPESAFHRIHKSYIISLNYLSEFNHEKVWLDQVTLPIGEFYSKSLVDKLQILQSEGNEEFGEETVLPVGISNSIQLNGHYAS
jgi:DNA-binding LytR/AlgR family response regulator